MLRFFRRIRQRFLLENRFSKYLLYALGEIILVMLGILLALQVNNWNEDQKQKKIEIEILEGIRTDLLRDTIDVQGNIRAYQRSIKNDSTLIANYDQKQAYSKDIAMQFLNMIRMGHHSIAFQQSYYQQAKNFGLQIISSKALRDQLSRLYEFDYPSFEYAENYSYENNLSIHIRDKIEPFIEGHRERGIEISLSNYQRMLEDGNLRYKMGTIIRLKKSMCQSYLNINKKINELAAQIEEELARLAY